MAACQLLVEERYGKSMRDAQRREEAQAQRSVAELRRQQQQHLE